MASKAPPGPPAAVTSNSLKSEKKIKAEDIAPAPAPVTSSGPRQVQVQCIAPYKEAAWIPIGREQEGAAANSVQYSQGLRPPGHVTAFIKIGGQASKGLTNSADNAMVYVVMRGEVTVMINSLQFTSATKGDIVYVPPDNTFNIINTGQDMAELFNFQYVVPDTSTAPATVTSKVQCLAPYKKAVWEPIGREQEGVEAASVQYSQGLNPPSHVAAFIRISSQASKGLTNSAANAMVFVVMRGEVTVVLNSSQFMATRGDTVYIPPHNSYNILNMGQEEAELFKFKYRNKPKHVI